jgi:hypothetical protein
MKTTLWLPSSSTSLFPRRSNAHSDEYFTALGSESGVVSLFNLNCTISSDYSPLFQVNSSSQRHYNTVAETPIKSLMNLTTKISYLAVHPSAEILAIASEQVIA